VEQLKSLYTAKLKVSCAEAEEGQPLPDEDPEEELVPDDEFEEESLPGEAKKEPLPDEEPVDGSRKTVITKIEFMCMAFTCRSLTRGPLNRHD